MAELIWDGGKLTEGEPPLAGEVAWGGFTTVGCARGRPLLWARHEARLRHTLEALLPGSAPGLPSEPDLEGLLAGRSLDGFARIRVVGTLPPGGRRWRVRAHATAVEVCGPGVPPVELAVVRWPGIPPLADLKTVSRLAWDLARVRARERGADDALLVTREGQVLEASVANVFAVLGSRLVTPPADGRCLPGVLRAWLLEAAGDLGLEAVEEPLELGRLLEADEVWLTGSVAGVRKVGSIGDRTFSAWPVWERLAVLGVPAPGWPERG